jgi:hypothetical protein
MTRFVSATCQGERCFCGAPAEHKVGEQIPDDDPRFSDDWHVAHGLRLRGAPFHELTAYVCHEHFRQIMGPAADR